MDPNAFPCQQQSSVTARGALGTASPAGKGHTWWAEDPIRLRVQIPAQLTLLFSALMYLDKSEHAENTSRHGMDVKHTNWLTQECYKYLLECCHVAWRDITACNEKKLSRGKLKPSNRSKFLGNEVSHSQIASPSTVVPTSKPKIWRAQVFVLQQSIPQSIPWLTGRAGGTGRSSGLFEWRKMGKKQKDKEKTPNVSKQVTGLHPSLLVF